MSWILEVYRSAMVKKAVMACTGVLLFGFVVAHLAGNLKIYQGPEKINAYAEGLRELGVPLMGHGDVVWLTRFALLAAVGLHMLSAWQLTVINRKARPIEYAKKTPQAATYASRTMRYGGVIVILFVVYHLLHLTVGSVHSDFKHGDLYHNIIVAFGNPLISGFYILAVTSLGFHLYHGLWSLFQSLGWSGPRFNGFRKRFALAFAIIITTGFVSIPISVLTGILS